MINTEPYYTNQLCQINNVFSHPIDLFESDNKSQYDMLQTLVSTNSLLKTPLMPHQQRMITSMYMYETSMTHVDETVSLVKGRERLYGKLGVIADPPGSGKTLSVLGFIATLKAFEASTNRVCVKAGELNMNSNKYFYSHTVEPVSVPDVSSTSIIIVPPNLLQQWRREIDTHTTMLPFVVDNRRLLRNRTTLDYIKNSHFILTTSRLYKNVYEYLMESGLRLKHVFIDEASSILLNTHDPVPQMDFMWLITSHWLGFLFKNTFLNPMLLQQARSSIPMSEECTAWLDSILVNNVQLSTSIESSSFFRAILPYTHESRWSLILRNSKKNHAVLPSIENTYLECCTKVTLATIPHTFIENNFEGLAHSCIPKLFRALDISEMTLDQVIDTNKSRTSLIHEKVGMTGGEITCSICLDAPQNKVLLSCCMNLFCGACILRQVLTHPQCPTCRSLLYLPNMLYVPEQVDVSGSRTTINRQDTCIQYISQNRGRSFIIYTAFENSYYQIYPHLEALGITCERLDSNVGKFNKTIANFNSGRTNVLFVSNVDSIRGVNLTKASHILFFYDVPFYERYQMVVHSALRIGRTEPLALLHIKGSLD